MRIALTQTKAVAPAVTPDPVIPAVPAVEAYVPPTFDDLCQLQAMDHAMASEALAIDVEFDQVSMGLEYLDQTYQMVKDNKFTLGAAITLKTSGLAKALGLETLQVAEKADLEAPYQVALEDVQNTIATVWQHILAWMKRVVALAKNTWNRFVNEMNDRKKLLKTLKETIKQKGIGGNESSFTTKKLNICTMQELNTYKEAASKIARVMEGFTSVDKMAAGNHATELAPDFTKIGYTFTQGGTDDQRYVLTKQGEMPTLTNDTLSGKGWNVSNVNQVIDDAIKTCDEVKSLERVLNVFDSAAGLVEKNISNSKQHMDAVESSTKEGVKEAATQVNNIRQMYQATLDALRKYVQIAVDVAQTATAQEHASAPASGAPAGTPPVP